MENDGKKPLLDDSPTNGESTAAASFVKDSGDGARSKENSSVENGERHGNSKIPAAIRNLEFKGEATQQLTIAMPMVFVNIFLTLILLVPLAFVGRLGDLELASASLANSIASVCGLHILIGMSTALETLCGQAYGAGRFHKLEIYLHRAGFVLLCVCVPITVLYVNIEKLLLFVGQTPEISAKSAEYVHYLIPMLYANALLQPLIRFLQSQSIVKPMFICGTVTLATHVALSWLIIDYLDYGYVGGAMASSISFWLNATLLICYVRFSRCCEKTLLCVWNLAAFKDLGSFLKLAVSSSFMICLEYWSFEVLVLVAGVLKNPELELSALSVCLNTTSLNYMIPFGLSAAASTRVSNELGARRSVKARKAVVVALILSCIQSVVVSTSIFTARDVWGKIFSNDPVVVQYVATLLPFVCLICIMDGLQGVLSGWQEVAAIVNLITFYVIGLPVGLFSAFYLEWGGKGLLTGLALGLGSQTSVLGCLVARTDWEEQANLAYARFLRSASMNYAEVLV